MKSVVRPISGIQDELLAPVDAERPAESSNSRAPDADAWVQGPAQEPQEAVSAELEQEASEIPRKSTRRPEQPTKREVLDHNELHEPFQT